MYYENHIFVCENVRPPGARVCCGAAGSKEVREYLKKRIKEVTAPGKRIRVNMSGCLDRCEEGPAVVCYPKGEWFRLRNLTEAEHWIQSYILNDNSEAVASLALPSLPRSLQGQETK